VAEQNSDEKIFGVCPENVFPTEAQLTPALLTQQLARMPGSDPRKHHTVPEFYLRPFSHRGRAVQICVFDRSSAKVFSTNIKNVAARRDYFARTKEDGSRDASLETHLSQIDGVCAGILALLIDGCEIDPEQMHGFATFVGLQYLRVPSKHREFGKSLDRLHEVFVNTWASNPEIFTRDFTRFQQQTGKGLEYSAETMRRDLLDGKYRVQATQEYKVATALRLLETVIEIFAGIKWAFFQATGTYKFLSSDSPVQELHEPSHLPKGLGSRDTLVVFPLAPGVCAVGSHFGESGFHDRGNEFVRMVNLTTIDRSDRFVFYLGPDKAVERFIEKTHQEILLDTDGNAS